MINYIQGDMVKAISETTNEVFVHGCNCFHTMGSGIARQLRETYPEVYEADKETNYGFYDKLGSGSFALVNSNIVVNMYTQFNYGNDKPHINYAAVRMCMNKLNHWFTTEESPYKIVNMPKIGCGLAGGEWFIVKQIIEEEFDDSVTVNVWYL